MDDSGEQELVDAGICMGEVTTSTYTVNGNVDPLTAEASIQHDLKMEYRGENHVDSHIKTDSKMTCDLDNFYLHDDINVTLNGEEFFKKQWKSTVSRRFL